MRRLHLHRLHKQPGHDSWWYTHNREARTLRILILFIAILILLFILAAVFPNPYRFPDWITAGFRDVPPEATEATDALPAK